MTKIEFKGINDDSFHRMPLYEPHKLPWALDEFKKVNLSEGVPKYLGIIGTKERDASLRFRSEVTSTATQNAFSEAGEYRFHGSVACDVGGAAHFTIGVRWNGQWDEVEPWLEASI